MGLGRSAWVLMGPSLCPLQLEIREIWHRVHGFPHTVDEDPDPRAAARGCRWDGPPGTARPPRCHFCSYLFLPRAVTDWGSKPPDGGLPRDWERLSVISPWQAGPAHFLPGF